MKCPVCKEPDLVMSDRQGIEIDYCPACRGVWLDRGELDKIVEKSTEAANIRPAAAEAPQPATDPYYVNHNHHDDRHKYSHNNRWKRKSWLSEIFD
jgi:Zn-finger nucleic acid-binding protein